MVTGNKKTSKSKKPKKVNNLRYAEYYDMQGTFDELFAKSKNGEVFDNLVELIFSRGNILLAYRNIKGNGGSVTPGTDGLTIRAVEKCTPEALVQKVRNIVRNYNPRAVRRKEIPKQSGDVCSLLSKLHSSHFNTFRHILSLDRRSLVERLFSVGDSDDVLRTVIGAAAK